MSEIQLKFPTTPYGQTCIRRTSKRYHNTNISVICNNCFFEFLKQLHFTVEMDIFIIF